MGSALSKTRNYFFPTTGSSTEYVQKKTGDQKVKNLGYRISPVQFARIRHDIQMWRMAIQEAEQAYYPQRVKMQRMFMDTVLNEHVISCIERRKDLTQLRDFKICDEKGEASDDLKLIFRNYAQMGLIGKNENAASWFDDFINHTLDAIFYGYSLISLGDVINDAFPELSVIRRQNISPDRENVTSIVYALSGDKFMEEPYADWHVWVPTPTNLGISKCGYGLLYTIAKSEIYVRNNTGYNADYIELFGQPIRKGRTTKTEGAERDSFELALRNMGSSAYILLDDGTDDVELVESKTTGTGWQSYEDFEKRNHQKISKVILGHADALDSVPGKLGAGNDEKSPSQLALSDKQVKDGIFVQNIINSKLLPRMRKHGFPIPINYHFEFLNDSEKEEFRRREDVSNKMTAEIAQIMSNSGMQMDAKYFTERTGIPATAKAEVPAPTIDKPNEPLNNG
jgi:phage gp29-like protein